MSTWSQDCARGLDHPDSVAARKQRMEITRLEDADRNHRFNIALRLISDNLKTEADVVLILNVTSNALGKLHGPESYLHPVVTKLDELADSIEYPEGV